MLGNRRSPSTFGMASWNLHGEPPICVATRCLFSAYRVFSSFMAGETIIVVDDAAVSLKFAAAALRGEGYTVRVACNAEEALMILRTMVPDLLLVDVQLPGMSGLELTRRPPHPRDAHRGLHRLDNGRRPTAGFRCGL